MHIPTPAPAGRWWDNPGLPSALPYFFDRPVESTLSPWRLSVAPMMDWTRCTEIGF